MTPTPTARPAVTGHSLTFDGRARGSRADQTTVRRANLGVVLRHVAAAGPCSRAEIAPEPG